MPRPSRPAMAGGRAPVLVTAICLAACSSPGPAPSCPPSTSEPLVNGAAEESYLGLADAQLRAIVQIVDATQADGPLCSGAFVAREWVVTAAHCLQIQSAEVVVPARAGLPSSTGRVLQGVAHPSEDLALMEVDLGQPSADLTGLEPLSGLAPGDFRLAAGEVVELAGYGLTEANTARELRFLAEPITAVGATKLTVSGLGASGACGGDSGGPLLVRAPNGEAAVAGVLTMGSGSCLEQDTYLRLDSVRDWVEQNVGSWTPAARDCGGITAEGRCLYGSALWCDAAELIAQACTGGQQCGWDVASGAFRCVDPPRDPCQGVDSVGSCRGDGALWCNAGILQLETCTCDTACRIDGATGAPRCR